MKTFMVTFGQSHPLRNYWVEVVATDYDKAREKIIQEFGLKWAFMYSDDNFDRKYFPLGKVGFTLEAD